MTIPKFSWWIGCEDGSELAHDPVDCWTTKLAVIKYGLVKLCGSVLLLVVCLLTE